jgi:PKHD-type hydroxylase
MPIREQAYYIYNNSPLVELSNKILAEPPATKSATTNSTDRVNERIGETAFITANDPLGQDCFKDIWKFVTDANHQSGWNFDIDSCEPFQFTKYDVNQKYDWHIDTIFNQDNTRKISFTLLLNDDFEGGDFQFEIGSPDQDHRITTVKLGKGDILFFPSDLWHRVMPVTKGTRYSLVGWCRGPHFR